MQSTVLDKPLVSFCILTYNQEEYIKDACIGALEQVYPNLEIIVSDDCSDDNTWKVVLDVVSHYHGSHKIVLNKNEKNLGIRENCNKCLYELAKGEIVLLAGGDDVSLPDRTRITVETMLNNPELSSISFKSQKVDKYLIPLKESARSGISDGYTTMVTLSDYLQNNNLFIFSGESRALRRNVIDAFPPLRYSRAEDIYLFLRSLYVGPIAYVRKPLVLYRQHDDSIMGKSRSEELKNKKLSRLQKKEKRRSSIESFNVTTRRQIREDFQYALEQGYIKKEQEPFVADKLAKVEEWLMPRKELSGCQKVAKKMLRIVKKAKKIIK